MGQNRLVLIGGLRQCAGHQFLAYADAEAACKQLREQETFRLFQLVPCRQNAGFPVFFIKFGKAF